MGARRAVNNPNRVRRLVGGFVAVSAWGMRCLLTCFLVFGLAAVARADRAADLARIHLEAIGGKERVAALSAMRATGQAIAGGKLVRFTMLAVRPDRLRLETENGARTLVQGTDGVEPPWEFDTGTWPPKYREMAESSARVFAVDAEFDDPLVAGEARGYTLEYAGEVEVGKRKLLRVLVTRKLRETFSVLLDDETYFIVMRVDHRTSPAGRNLQVVTHFDDFRPVAGVLLAHRITVAVDGQPSQQTKIVHIEANPEFKPDVFSRPKVAVTVEAKP